MLNQLNKWLFLSFECICALTCKTSLHVFQFWSLGLVIDSNYAKIIIEFGEMGDDDRLQSCFLKTVVTDDGQHLSQVA